MAEPLGTLDASAVSADEAIADKAGDPEKLSVVWPAIRVHGCVEQFFAVLAESNSLSTRPGARALFYAVARGRRYSVTVEDLDAALPEAASFFGPATATNEAVTVVIRGEPKVEA